MVLLILIINLMVRFHSGGAVLAVFAVARCPVCNGGGEVGSRRRLHYFSAQGKGLCLVGIERGKLRGEVTAEAHCLRVATREVDDGVQLLLLTRHAKQAHGCRVFPGIGAGGYLRELQFHVSGCGVDAGREVQRPCYARQVALDAFYPVRGAARRFDDERQLAYLLLHGGGQFVLGVLFDYYIHSAREQPTGRGSHERAHTVPITESCGNGSGCAAYRDLFRCVIDIGTVCSRLEQVVYPACTV